MKAREYFFMQCLADSLLKDYRYFKCMSLLFSYNCPIDIIKVKSLVAKYVPKKNYYPSLHISK